MQKEDSSLKSGESFSCYSKVRLEIKRLSFTLRLYVFTFQQDNWVVCQETIIPAMPSAEKAINNSPLGGIGGF